MRTLLISLLIFCVLNSHAQDPNFSQFFTSPLTLNPALTGKFDGVFRVAGNYRNQWPSINNAFTTATASFDVNILRNHIPEFDQFGVGVLVLNDKSANGALQNNYVALSTSYHKALDENGFHQVGLGFQGAWINQRFDRTKVTFEDELTTNGWMPMTSSETFNQSQLSVSLFDASVGAFYNGTTNGINNIYFGTSIYHVNQPRQSFQNAQYFLRSRITLQAGGMLPLNGGNALHISGLHSMQQGAYNTVFGAAYMLNLSHTGFSLSSADRSAYDDFRETNLYAGLWTRLNNVNDALIPYVGLEWHDLRFGFSYDVNVSSLKPGSNLKGGAEISLIYIKKPGDPYAKKLNCPKF